MKKFLSVGLTLVMLSGIFAFIPAALNADQCSDVYLACLKAAGEDRNKLNGCLKELGSCRGYPVIHIPEQV